jgi:transcriptional regulator with XRE-family HTH domain
MDAAEVGRRVRAARAYAFGADRGRDEVAKAINVSTRTLSRIESGRRPLSDEEKAAVAQACGLPPEFFSIDFSAAERPANGEIAPRLVQLEQLVRDLDPVDTRTRLRNAETQLASLVQTREHLTELQSEVRSLQSQLEALTQEALARRQRDALERESGRRASSRGIPGAEDDRQRGP